MTLSAGSNITGLNHTLNSVTDCTIITLQAWKSQGKYPKQRILIVYTNYWLHKNMKTLIYHVYSTHKQCILYWCSLTSKVRRQTKNTGQYKEILMTCCTVLINIM